MPERAFGMSAGPTLPPPMADVGAPCTRPDQLADSSNAPLEPELEQQRAPFGFSLFWRTFFLLALLLLGTTLGWYQMFRALEYEPRVIDNARQIASMVNLSRAALIHSDAIARVSLIKTLAEQEKVRIAPREPGDRFELFNHTVLERRMSGEIVARLGLGTVVARRVNGEEGLWVGFSIEGDSYWLLMDRSRIGTLLSGSAWLLWLATLGAASLLGAALLAGYINRPLRQLANAAERVREGDYRQGRLDESTRAREIRAVNIGFNRMAEELSRIEQERAEMLAGISHDLRTPLARLRLETEMSVADENARNHMAADIDQLDGIIDKFLEYARPGMASLSTVALAEVVEACAYPFRHADDIIVRVDVHPGLRVLADEVELARVLSNLLENARRYGKSPQTGVALVEIAARQRNAWVLIKVRDHGTGVAPDALDKLTKPFYRGDAARTAASGAGLGLSIVDKTVQRMGGAFALANGSSGGLAAHIRLRAAP